MKRLPVARRPLEFTKCGLVWDPAHPWKEATLELSTGELTDIAAAIDRTGAGEGPTSPESVEAWRWEAEVQEESAPGPDQGLRELRIPPVGIRAPFDRPVPIHPGRPVAQVDRNRLRDFDASLERA